MASRTLSWALISSQVVIGLPATTWAQEAAPGVDETAPLRPPPPPKVKVNRTAPKVDPVLAYPVFSNNPSVEEIFRARVFGEPLVPVDGTPSQAENEALAHAVTTFLRQRSNERFEPLERFLKEQPSSPWRPSLLMNLGVLYRRKAYFTRAEKAFREAWDVARGAETRNERAVADRALKELLEYHMTFGHTLALEELLKEVEGRDVLGGTGEAISRARACVWILNNDHANAIASGPVALSRLREHQQPGVAPDPEIASFHATPEGATLVQMRDLALKAGMKVRIALREEGAAIPLPALVHLRAQHFSAIVSQQDDRFLLDDPLLGGAVWMSREALEEEISGFFLIRQGALPKGWKEVDDRLAAAVRGKCQSNLRVPTQTGNQNNTSGGNGPSCPGMATYTFHSLLVSLRVVDTPLGYTPPRGPGVQFRAVYNQKEYYQPLIFYYSNLGSLWSFDWVAHIEDDPGNLSADVYVFPSGGGRHTATGFDGQSYQPHRDTQEVVTRVVASPIRYERVLPDGSKEVFTQSDGAMTSPRRVFMTEAVDSQGNKLTFTYDAQLRLVAVTDAIGQVTTLSYDLGTDPLKVTKVTDPFGRSASLAYGSDGRLASITDVIGLKSEFSYGFSDFVTNLTTPYGTTSFATGSGIFSLGDHWLEATDPLGGRERIEFIRGNPTIPAADPAGTVPPGFGPSNTSINIYSSYFFDKRAMALSPGDYTKAKMTRWNNATTLGIWDSQGSGKLPLENRVWNEYASSPFIHGVGPMNKPIKAARVLDDGSAQIYQYEYNAKGSKTREIDPLGRETVYEYDANEIDLLRVKVKNGAGYDLVASYTYNTQHQPLTATNGANQTTTYTYTASGQIQTVTTPPRAGISEQRTTTYTYDPGTDRLLSVTAPGNVTTSYTYDGYGRLRTTTDSDSYTLTYDYDALDRPTRTTYPDATNEETQYDRLDPAKRRDRLGRWTQTFFDALRRVTATRDPAGHVVTQQWCGCGSLDKLVDPNGNATTWDRDAEGRVIKETRANGSFKQLVYENTTGRLKKTIDAKNQEIQYTYALDGKLTQTTYVNAQIPTPNVSFAYDTTHGRLTSLTDGTGPTTYTYHPFGQLGAGQGASVDGPLTNDTATYAYDELGRVVSRTLNGVTSTWSYDQQGRLTSQGDPIGTFAYTYDGNSGRAATVTYPNGQASTYAYLPNSGDHRLQQIHHKQPGGATLNKFDYTYELVGNIKTWTQQTDSNPAQLYDLEYDPADQLTAATLRTTGAPPQILKRYRYAYDAAGNRTAEQIDTAVTGATYDNMNRLQSHQPGGALAFRGTVSEPSTVTVQGQPVTVSPTNEFTGAAQVPPGTSNVVVTASDPAGNVRTNTYQVSGSGTTRSFTYDNNGDLASKVEGAVTTTYEWNAANRLTAVKQGSTTLAAFTYDGSGRRATKTAGGVTASYVYDGAQFLEERPSAGAAKRYVYGPGIDRLLAQVVAGAISHSVADHLGSVVRTTDATGAPTLTREYDLWGNPLQGSSTGGYAFTGREWDAEANLYYYRARYYDPNSGRFLAEDPSRSGTNFYEYVANNPIIYADPLGLVKKITVCKDEQTLTLCDDKKELMKAPVKCGCSNTPTPTGNFKAGSWVKDPTNRKFSGPDPWTKDPWGNPYGPWFLPIQGTSGVGIHGTRGWQAFGNTFISCPDFDISPLCSHGCIRMSNGNIQQLHDLLPNSAGTPVTIKDACK